ncbi:MAG: Lin1244/Lin1753 domain-containing protein [Mangrovibacterium sp.]
MSKESFYFPHDSNARNDDKLIAVRMKLGAEGYGIYFMILERLMEGTNYMSVKDYNIIAFDLRVDTFKVKSVIEDFGLFVFVEDDKYFYSESFNRRMIPLENIREQRRLAGKKSAEKRAKLAVVNDEVNKNSTTVERPLPKNPTEESKVKESKEEDTPLPPKGDESEPLPWKKDYQVYLNGVREAFKLIKANQEWIAKQEKFNPGIDILKSIEKACVNFWATEAGWKKKKRAKIVDIDWKATFGNAIPLTANRVFKDRFPLPAADPVKPKLVKPERW